jgi:NAD(P)H dehydrogenase (quinone)
MFVIFGATGGVGLAAVTELRRAGQAVRAVVRDVARARAGELAERGAELAVADLRDEACIARALDGADGALLLIPLDATAAEPAADAQRIIEAMASAVERTKPPRLVLLSDYGAEQPEGTGVTAIFHALERRFGDVPGRVTFLRSAEHMENWKRYLPFVRATGRLPTMHHPVTKRFPTVAARDVGVEAARLLASPSSPSIVHLEGPERYSSLDVAAVFAARLGAPVAVEALPRQAWSSALEASGLGAGYARLVCELQEAHNAGRIDVAAGGKMSRGATRLSDALAAVAVS